MIQVVCVKWGTRYDARHVNGMYRAIVSQTESSVRFVCVTDADDAYDEEIIVKPFPDFNVPFERLTHGCMAKISMFQEGVLEPGIETIFLDLDTMVCGDLQRLADRLKTRPGLYMMRNHLVPLWRGSRFLKAVWPKKYYFGNSSILAFYPEQFYWLAERLKEKLHTGQTYFHKELASDERFISCSARDHIRVFSRCDAVKFAAEYMAVFPFIEKLRQQIPWVESRRQSIAAVTFAGLGLKPDTISKVQTGDLVREKCSAVRWNFSDFSRYWREVLR